MTRGEDGEGVQRGRTREEMAELCWVLAEILQQLMCKGEKEAIENIDRLVSDANLGTGEF